MEWYWSLALILGPFMLLLFLGVPIVFAFLSVNIAGMYLLMGGEAGLEQLINSIFRSLNVFVLLPITLFILMGEVMFRSGVATRMVETLDKWIGRVPGRLSLLTIGSGALLSSMSGSSIGTTAMLASTLVPDMERRGYKAPMSLGPVLGSGGLSIMIPPSGLGVVLAVLAKVSVATLLIAIIIPGVLLAVAYAAYVLIRCSLRPEIAPPYAVAPTPLVQKLYLTVKYVLPLGFIIFLVVGLIFLGVATPTEAAALGTAGSFALAAAYGTLTREAVRAALTSTLRTSVMVLVILAAADAFSQVLAFTGASRGLVSWALELPLSPMMLLIAMLIVLLLLGMILAGVPLMMITLPIFMPMVTQLGYDPIWFCVLFLLLVEMGQTTPPYGILLFVMKGVVPDKSMGSIIRAAVPFLLCDLLVLILIVAIPALALWLPARMVG